MKELELSRSRAPRWRNAVCTRVRGVARWRGGRQGRTRAGACAGGPAGTAREVPNRVSVADGQSRGGPWESSAPSTESGVISRSRAWARVGRAMPSCLSIIHRYWVSTVPVRPFLPGKVGRSAREERQKSDRRGWDRGSRSWHARKALAAVGRGGGSASARCWAWHRFRCFSLYAGSGDVWHSTVQTSADRITGRAFGGDDRGARGRACGDPRVEGLPRPQRSQ